VPNTSLVKRHVTATAAIVNNDLEKLRGFIKTTPVSQHRKLAPVARVVKWSLASSGLGFRFPSLASAEDSMLEVRCSMFDVLITITQTPGCHGGRANAAFVIENDADGFRGSSVTLNRSMSPELICLCSCISVFIQCTSPFQ